MVISRRGAEDRKGAGTSSGKSVTRNLEAENIRSVAESRGLGRVCKVEDGHRNTTEQSRHAFIAQRVYLVLSSLWVHACLAVTCQLHFWQNDQDL